MPLFTENLPRSSENLHRWDRERNSEKGSRLDVWGAYEKGPPPIAKASKVFTPIIFRAIKVEKSRLGLIGKNFGKNLWENVSGKEKAPNLVERGRGAKI